MYICIYVYIHIYKYTQIFILETSICRKCVTNVTSTIKLLTSTMKLLAHLLPQSPALIEHEHPVPHSLPCFLHPQL